jgi:hypothetical protein
MSEFEDIQRLLRLKRYEKPPEDFVEDFVRQFQHRQRQELLRHSARGLLWERVNTYFEGLFAPKWRWAGATAVALVLTAVIFRPGSPVTGGNKASDQVASRNFNYSEKQAPISDAEVERYLISRHFEGGLGNELTPVNYGPEVTPVQQNRPAPSLKQDLLAR